MAATLLWRCVVRSGGSVAGVGAEAFEQLPHRLYLFYSNRRPEDAAFLAELQQLEEVNPNYRLIATMTQRAMHQTCVLIG